MESAGSGRIITGRYRLSNVIGRGGMGVVWQARDELLSRDVAVKELAWPAYFSAQEQRAACRRATREAKVAARLSHRNVIRIFDIIEEDGCPWIVMELLPPRSLRDVVEEEGPLSPAQAAEVGLEILAALRAAHASGIVHRDVKPANILMAPDRVVLTDFGIAQADGTSTLTTVGVLMGSPSYMAPERARGRQSGPPADLWGLGASLYAAVEGHGPFDRDGGALASLTAVVADEPEAATHAGPLLWPVISGLLRKDPDKRLDAAQAERMLRRVGAVPAAPVGAGTARPRRSHAPAAIALTGSAALAVIVASSAVAGFTPTSSPRHETSSAAALVPPAPASARVPAASAHRSAPVVVPRAPAGTHVTARTSRAATPRSSSSRSTPSSRSSSTGNTGNVVGDEGRLMVRAGRFIFSIPYAEWQFYLSHWPVQPAGWVKSRVRSGRSRSLSLTVRGFCRW
jgi:eukaryotic-like serine/threonine-protein kinase